jgi:hypothetical protein
MRYYRHGFKCDEYTIIDLMNSKEILDYISAIRAERDPEKRLSKLQNLNEHLPTPVKLEMPSLVTNAYVRRALDIIEERLAALSSNGASRSRA